MTGKVVYGTSTISKVDVVDETRLNEARNWVEQIIGKKVQGNDFFDGLKDGVILCELLNAIKPSTCRKYKLGSKQAFHHRSNIQIYLLGCRKIGIPVTDCFETRDLYDRQRLSAVVNNLFSLSAQSRKIGFSGPSIGVEYYSPNKRNFTQAQLNKSKSAVASWAKGSNKTDTSSGMDGYGIVKTKDGTHSGVQSVWEKGSIKNTGSGGMDSYGIVKTKDGSHSGVQSVWEKGGIKNSGGGGMDSYGIVKTKDGSHTGVQSVWEQGAKPVDSNTMDSYGIIKQSNT